MAGTLTIDTLQSSTSGPAVFKNTSGVEVGQLCRAWVNFNGTTGTMRASFNVGSITKNGTGDYTANFTNALTDSNYGVQIGRSIQQGVVGGLMGTMSSSGSPTLKSTTQLRIYLNNGGTSAQDDSDVSVSVFR